MQYNIWSVNMKSCNTPYICTICSRDLTYYTILWHKTYTFLVGPHNLSSLTLLTSLPLSNAHAVMNENTPSDTVLEGIQINDRRFVNDDSHIRYYEMDRVTELYKITIVELYI